MLRALLLVVPVALMLCTGLSTAAATTVGNVCEEDACEADTSMRVVEYFGADWCEPCRPVEAMLDALERPDVLVVRHAPSPQDTGFSNLSYQRFDAHYGLISLPAIVIDGYAVLTGETMTLRLEEALNVTEGGPVEPDGEHHVMEQSRLCPKRPAWHGRQRQFEPLGKRQRHMDDHPA